MEKYTQTLTTAALLDCAPRETFPSNTVGLAEHWTPRADIAPSEQTHQKETSSLCLCAVEISLMTLKSRTLYSRPSMI